MDPLRSGVDTRLPEHGRGASWESSIEDHAATREARQEEVIRTLVEAVRTGAVGDGKIFVSQVDEAIRIRDDSRGEAAL